MHNRLKNVQKRITFNFENFANATEDILQMDVNAIDPEDMKEDSPIKKGMTKRLTVQLDEEQKALLLPKEKSATKLASDEFNFKQPTGRYILTKSQRERWNKIIQHVPQEYRVYIQASFH